MKPRVKVTRPRQHYDSLATRPALPSLHTFKGHRSLFHSTTCDPRGCPVLYGSVNVPLFFAFDCYNQTVCQRLVKPKSLVKMRENLHPPHSSSSMYDTVCFLVSGSCPFV